ncbi:MULTISPECIES: SUMF1/EgtB/PvdO family nonheme iron enzyme [Rhodomicrobium]|uniref:SUMF1/EgtB/PvdO family nonheme iron enzyme n=1 Tax=Rhodomicrobium TaxID=1068 RepID=UPI000B4B05B6|nr:MULTISPECIES: SUMF1/EgtB/PvdO family nonheme iron enzyme [Rhodomicrobium]
MPLAVPDHSEQTARPKEVARATSEAGDHRRASPVTAFPPNGFGVHDMIGNVGRHPDREAAP